ncbi:MAG: N5-glutamine S-adenosyl-L-methionine-dependent methyltransferase, partial [Chlamydiota bacterium]
KKALVAGNSGTEFYEVLASTVEPFLNPGGQLFFEIGSTQKEALFKIFASGPWGCKEIIPDWSGKDRFFFLEKETVFSL